MNYTYSFSEHLKLLKWVEETKEIAMMIKKHKEKKILVQFRWNSHQGAIWGSTGLCDTHSTGI